MIRVPSVRLKNLKSVPPVFIIRTSLLYPFYILTCVRDHKFVKEKCISCLQVSLSSLVLLETAMAS